jgi:hypothetical protein
MSFTTPHLQSRKNKTDFCFRFFLVCGIQGCHTSYYAYEGYGLLEYDSRSLFMYIDTKMCCFTPLKKAAADISKALVPIDKTTWHHVLAGGSLDSECISLTEAQN